MHLTAPELHPQITILQAVSPEMQVHNEFVGKSFLCGRRGGGLATYVGDTLRKVKSEKAKSIKGRQKHI
jgi:hypothetical protein